MFGLVEDQNGKEYPFANIYQSDQYGKPTGNGVSADEVGFFNFDIDNNVYITVSHVESKQKITFFHTGKKYYRIVLNRGLELSEVEIKAKKIKKALNVAFFLGLIYTILNN